MAREKYFYDILSVSSDASVEEIARSYKKMALKCHPDKTNHNPQLTEKFKEATRAYEVLKDDNKRKIYDAYGEAGLDGTEDVSQPAKRPPYSATSTSSTSSSNIHVHSAHNVFSQVFSDINSIFGNDPTSSSTSFFSQFPMNMDMNMNMNMNMNTQGMKKSVQPAPADPRADRPIRGQDIHHTFKVTLADLYFGKVVRFQLPKNSRCKECGGHGCFHPKLCHVCAGSGRVFVTMFNQYSKFQELSLCKACRGTGSYISPADKCLHCNNGYLKENKIIKVNILPGSKNGDRCILQGEADQGPNIIPGDVIIHLQEIPHKYLVRRFNDLYAEYSIDLKTALLGGSFIMKDFIMNDNQLKITINAHGYDELNDKSIQQGEIVGTINPGTPKIVKGFGMPINNTILDGVFYQDSTESIDMSDVIFDMNRYKKGNLFIKFNVELPNLSDFTGGLNDLKVLQQILPNSSTQGSINENESFNMESHLSNISSLNKNAPKLAQTSNLTPQLKNVRVNIASSPSKSSKLSDNNSVSSTSTNHEIDSQNLKRPKRNSDSSDTQFNYDDIDIDDKVDGDEIEEELFYNDKWSNNGKKRKRNFNGSSPSTGINVN